jgi:hypothetical protein
LFYPANQGVNKFRWTRKKSIDVWMILKISPAMCAW